MSKTRSCYLISEAHWQTSYSFSTGHASQSTSALVRMSSYRFPCSIGSNQNCQRSEEGYDLFVFILNPKAPHPKDAHFVYLWHFGFLKEREQHKLHLKFLSQWDQLQKIWKQWAGYWLVTSNATLKLKLQAVTCWFNHKEAALSADRLTAATNLHWVLFFSSFICHSVIVQCFGKHKKSLTGGVIKKDMSQLLSQLWRHLFHLQRANCESNQFVRRASSLSCTVVFLQTSHLCAFMKQQQQLYYYINT